MSAQPASSILDARDLQIPSLGPSPALSLDLVLRPGDFVLILSTDTRRSGHIVDHLLGVAEPVQPGASFRGRQWIDQESEQAFLLRREIGRVQCGGNWIETRSVMDNVLLPAMHNRVTTEHALRQEASALAQRFGLPGLPTLPAARVPPPDLRRAACVRAFLGRPTLVVLEHPLDAEDFTLLSPIINAIQQVRRRQGAVLWFTGHPGLAVDPSVPADRRFRLMGAKLAELRP